MLQAIPCDVAWLNDRLFGHPARVYGLTRGAYLNAVSGLRQVLRRFDLIDAFAISEIPPGSPWSDLLASLAEFEHCQLGLRRFAGWCHQMDVRPADVDASTLADFERYARTRLLHSNLPDLLRTIRKSWKKAVELNPSLPGRAFRKANPRQPYTFPLSAYPSSFQEDTALFERRLRGADRRGPFKGDGLKQALRPRTVELRLYSVRQAASALVLQGRDIATITSLGDLVTPDAAEAILLFYWERAVSGRITRGELSADDEPAPDAGVTTQTAAIAATLTAIARVHCKFDAGSLAAEGDLRRLLPLSSGSHQSEESRPAPAIR